MLFSTRIKYGLGLLVIAFILLGSMLRDGVRLSLPVLAESGTVTSTAELPLPEPGKSALRELSGGQKHAYLIPLNTGQYVSAFIERRNMDVGLTLFDPHDRVLIQLDCRQYDVNAFSLIAESAGSYRLEVQPLEKEEVHGQYELRVNEIRPATAKDNSIVAAQRAVAEGEQLRKEWKAASSLGAIDKFKESLLLWRSAGDRREEAHTLRRIGDVYQPLGEYKQALIYYDQALSIAKETEDHRSEGEMLNEICYSYLNTGENQKALKLCTQALHLNRATENRRGTARALNNLGEVYYGLGQSQQALAYYQKALPEWRERRDKQGQALTLLNVGYIYSDLGQMREALESYNQALALWISALDQRGQAMTLTALGRLHSRIGGSQEALNYFEQAMQLIQPIGALAEMARTLNGIAYVYDQLGDKEKAIAYYNQAFPLFHATKDYGEAATLYDAGRVFYSLGDYQKALEYYQQALSISAAARDRRLAAFEVREIGRIYDVRGDEPRALDYYFKALSFQRAEKSFRGEAETLNLIGRIFERRAKTENAFEYYERALLLSQKAEYPIGEIATLHNIAHLERDRDNLSAARERTERALRLIESQRTKVISNDLRSSYFASVREHYELYIDVLTRLQKQHRGNGWDAQAFEISERARARSLLESLNEARAQIREGVDGSLLERERIIRQTLNARAERHGQLVASVTHGSELEAVTKEVDQLTREYEDVEAQIKLKSPRYAALTQPQPLSLEEIQQQVLDDNSLLLEYMLGDERSYVWAVTQTEVATFELPGRKQIEDAAFSFHKLLTANQPLPGETFAQLQDRLRETNAQIPAQAASFSKLVLGSVMSKLGRKRLIIVPDGALQYIPFQALMVPATTNLNDAAAPANANVGGEDLIPLMVDHEIVNEPSASALALVLKETAQRKQAPNTLAVFANPVFETDDPRIKSQGSSETQKAPQESQVRQVFRDAGFGEGQRIPSLPASREEADAIMAVVPWRTGFKAEGFEASRATVARPELGQYRIVHFATHGFVNYQHPELSGLVLSLVDEKGKPQDGFLRMHDIYNLKLPVDLVVLSACNTALGKDVKGEGLIGLTRGFMYAGAGGVVASLWKVDDDATAELMTHFYQGMFKRGLTPAAALREAQLAMWHQKRWHASYYWAAFVIQGQYNQHVDSGTRHHMRWVAVLGVLAGGLSLGMFFLWLRRRRRIL